MLDLTRLEDHDDELAVQSFCARAHSDWGHPAAICIYPQYIATARSVLAEHGLTGRVHIATVTNFPSGAADPGLAAEQTRTAIAAGADEVDVVLPWRALLAGDERSGRQLVERCKAACGSGVLKVILETGALGNAAMVRRAADLAIQGGADFLKTSTGKMATGATPQAARVMLEAIADSGGDIGLKVSGGIRTLADAIVYMELAASMLGADWVRPAHFRIGASGLLDDLLGVLQRQRRPA